MLIKFISSQKEIAFAGCYPSMKSSPIRSRNAMTKVEVIAFFGSLLALATAGIAILCINLITDSRQERFRLLEIINF